MYVYCIYTCIIWLKYDFMHIFMHNLSYSSPFINVVNGVFFVVRVTLVPVSYLSAPSAVHSYRIPGKFIRRLKSLSACYMNCFDAVNSNSYSLLLCLLMYQLYVYIALYIALRTQPLLPRQWLMYVFCVYPAMSKKSENLSDNYLNKKDRNKRHSSPFINVVNGVFFVVRVTLVPVSYLSE
jgi:hypothetical protein